MNLAVVNDDFEMDPKLCKWISSELTLQKKELPINFKQQPTWYNARILATMHTTKICNPVHNPIETQCYSKNPAKNLNQHIVVYRGKEYCVC